jgi:hypothetical protein
VVGTWKKYNIKPAANTKCATIILIMIMKEYLENRKAGINVKTRTEPDRKAAVETSSHCKSEN